MTLITSLTGQGVDRVSCGSAHSMAWSTGNSRTRKRNNQAGLPASVPLKYNLLQAIPISVLRNRLVLLNQFSGNICRNNILMSSNLSIYLLIFTEILCSCIPFLPLMDQCWRAPLCFSSAADFTCAFNTASTSRRFPDSLRGLLINSGKECYFRKVVQTTMIREKQHGPNIELNRIEVN